MSACGNCGSSKICTCAFRGDASVTLTGDGRSYAPINWRPNNVPLPRPYGYIFRGGSDQIFSASSVEVPIVFTVNETPFANSMVVPPAQGTGLSIDRLVAPVAGYYLIYTLVSLDTPAAVGNAIVSIRKNNTSNLVSQITGTDEAPTSLMTLEQMAINDYIQVVVTTPAGGNTTTDASSGKVFTGTCTTFPTFWAQWMRGL